MLCTQWAGLRQGCSAGVSGHNATVQAYRLSVVVCIVQAATWDGGSADCPHYN
jgi:hypothetical protein